MLSPGANSLASTLTSATTDAAATDAAATAATDAATTDAAATSAGPTDAGAADATTIDMATEAASSGVRHRQQRSGSPGRAGGVVNEREKDESEPSGSSELCQSGTEMSGNVRGLVGTEGSVQLSGGTAAEEQGCSGGTASVGKQRGQQSPVVTQSQSQSQSQPVAAAPAVVTDSDREVTECSTDGRSVAAMEEGHLCEESTVSVDECGGQQAVGTSSISGTSGSGGQSSVCSSDISGDREFDSTLGHPGEDLGSLSRSSSQSGGSTPVTPVRESDSSARAVRARARAVIVARQQTAQTELDQLEQLEQRHETALNSPSTPAVERELKDIEGELQRIVLSAGLPVSPMRRQ